LASSVVREHGKRGYVASRIEGIRVEALHRPQPVNDKNGTAVDGRITLRFFSRA
jgi:hypothetical protein